MSMHILNFGSLNLDRSYLVSHFVGAGETLSSCSMTESVGGKGFNQSIALSRAGCSVCHAGKVGLDGA
ncbi:MAG: ribokinase, partial [Pseudoflavonifractor sp.]